MQHEINKTRYLILPLLIGSFVCLSACGGGGGNDVASSSLASGANVADIAVDSGMGTVNSPFVTVTLCTPGSTTQCVNIDHVLVDTGSTGLRVMASLLNGIALPDATDASNNPLYNCAQFVDGYVFGSLKRADLHLANETASALTVHVIDDSASPALAAPADCSNGTPSLNSVGRFFANGVLGISTFREDCGIACESNVIAGTYYTLANAAYQNVSAPIASQVHNPVADFSTDNNGVIVQFQSIGSAGTFLARGALIFGIGTQSNNQVGSATVLGVDAISGRFITSYQGTAMTASLFDTGSNGLFFNDNSLTPCTSTAATGFYCPASAQTRSATLLSATNSNSSTVNFNVANADALTNNQPTYVAFNNLAGPGSSNVFDWGMPFFYGRSVFIAIEGQATPVGTGPFLAVR